MMEDKDPLDAESLDLPPSRELEEVVALLAYDAVERKPPVHLKERLMASIRPAASPFTFKRWAWPTVAAMAAAALVVVFAFRGSRDGATLEDVRGLVTVDGRPAAGGARVAWGSVVAVSEDGEAVIRVGRRAGLGLSRGGRARLTREGSALSVHLESGWLLSAVRTGAPYAVVTPHSRVTALGTDFIVKVHDGRAYVCICHGRIGLKGDFPRDEIASESHGAVSEPLFERGPEGPMEGHSDEDIARLRELTSLPR